MGFILRPTQTAISLADMNDHDDYMSASQISI